MVNKLLKVFRLFRKKVQWGEEVVVIPAKSTCEKYKCVTLYRKEALESKKAYWYRATATFWDGTHNDIEILSRPSIEREGKVVRLNQDLAMSSDPLSVKKYRLEVVPKDLAQAAQLFSDRGIKTRKGNVSLVSEISSYNLLVELMEMPMLEDCQYVIKNVETGNIVDKGGKC